MRGRNPCIQQPASCIRSRVGAPRLELGTSALSGPRSNQLSYAPAVEGFWRSAFGQMLPAAGR